MMTHVRLAMILPICLFSLPYQVLSGFGVQVNAGECLEHGENTVEENLVKLHGERTNLEKTSKVFSSRVSILSLRQTENENLVTLSSSSGNCRR